jgi:large subunit ribosomal protein L37Ae
MRTPRYGIKIRRRLDEIHKMQTTKYRCPTCKRLTMKRVAAGIWVCKKCGFKVASKAYKFESASL